jgi:FK506-binding nuclear protein
MESDSESEFDEDEENDLYDESPDEDELLFDDEEDEEDELDDLDGRIEEITEDLSARIEGESKGKSKGTKRPREEEEEAPELVDTSKKAVADDIDMSGLSKSQRKKLKKQRRESNESNPVNGSDKKVQFDTTPKGPSPSASESTIPAKPALSAQVKSESKPAAKKEKKTLANGVVIEDAKTGSGPMAKSGSKLAVRYIGKLKNGKVFDKNTKGAPFRFVLGKGEVITGTSPSMGVC